MACVVAKKNGGKIPELKKFVSYTNKKKSQVMFWLETRNNRKEKNRYLVFFASDSTLLRWRREKKHHSIDKPCLRKATMGGWHSTEVAFALLTQPSRVRISALPKFSNNWNIEHSDKRKKCYLDSGWHSNPEKKKGNNELLLGIWSWKHWC